MPTPAVAPYPSRATEEIIRVTDETDRGPQYWMIVSGIGNFRASRDLGFTVQGLKSRHRRKA